MKQYICALHVRDVRGRSRGKRGQPLTTSSLFTALDRLHELLGFDFFELQLRRKPLRVVLVLEVVHALRAAGSIGHFFVRECGLNSEGLGKFPVTR